MVGPLLGGWLEIECADAGQRRLSAPASPSATMEVSFQSPSPMRKAGRLSTETAGPR